MKGLWGSRKSNMLMKYLLTDKFSRISFTFFNSFKDADIALQTLHIFESKRSVQWF